MMNAKDNDFLSVLYISILCGIFLILSGCGTAGLKDDTVNTYPKPVRTPPTVENRVIGSQEEPDIISKAESSNVTIEDIDSGVALSPVVSKLAKNAEQQRQLSNLDVAANQLERALRIEPRNAFLWAKLAQIKFEQEDWQQTTNLAAKSNTLNQNDETLRRQTLYLMVLAFQKMGDMDAAAKYQQQLR